MNFYLATIIACFFAAYIFFDAMAVIARTSASQIKRNAFGAAVEKMMNTLKRIMIFFYPPILGYFVVNADLTSIIQAIIGSYIAATVLLILLIKRREVFLSYFCSVAKSFTAGQGVFKSFVSLNFGKKVFTTESCAKFTPATLNTDQPRNLRKFFRLTVMASWIYFIFGASIFTVNILALTFTQFAPIILQCLGLINGLGTFVLAFFVDPAISRFLDESIYLDEVVLSLLIAQFLACSVFAPIYFYLLISYI